MNPKIKLDETRGKLYEGRTTGIGFALLKKLADDSYEGVQPISPCKDYLNDVVYTEQTGKDYAACGLRTTKRGCFDDFAYMAFATCHSNGGTKYKLYDDEVKLIDTNLPNAQKVMNDIEKLLGLATMTEFVLSASNLAFAKIPKEWVSSTWAISLWALLARNAIYSQGGEAFAELEKTKMDKYAITTVIPRIHEFAKSGFPKQDWDDMNGVHGHGILNYPGAKA